jgi:hypothetical protein
VRKRATPRPYIVAKRQRKEFLRRKLAAKRRWEKQRAQGPNSYLVRAPRFFGLVENAHHRGVVSFVRDLVDLAVVQRKRVCIDFTRTRKCYADGTLLFYAELKRILKRNPLPLTCRLPKDRVVAQVLSHLGILKDLGYTKHIPSRRDDVINWRAFSGVFADATKGVGKAIENLGGISHGQIKKMYRSVSEALTNVTQHAYMEPRMDGSGNADDSGWWMFVREQPDELLVNFCDLGVGVPYSVPKLPKHQTWLQQGLSTALAAVGVDYHRDGETIQVTVAEKRSRFRATHRGNGFGNMLESIAVADSGVLMIHSNRGSYTYRREGGKETQETRNYHDSLYGTLIVWQIKLGKEAA